MKIYKFLTATTILSLTLLNCSGGGGGGGSSTCDLPAPVGGTENANQIPITTPTIAPLTGCTLIDYSVATTVGATANLNLIVDSGSTTLAVASAQCPNCSGLSPLYAAGASEQNTCYSAESEYLDGSGWNGNVVNDSVQVPGSPSTAPSATVSFASITTQSQFFTDSDCSGGATGANSSQGIMGFAGNLESAPGTVSYLDALNAQSNYPNLFAVQFCMSGGNMWFGNYDPTYTATSSTVQYTPIQIPNDFFWVNLTDIVVGTTPPTDLNLNANSFPGGVIVDTGTSIGLFPTAVFNAIEQAVTSNTFFQQYIGGDSTWFEEGNCSPSSAGPSTMDTHLPTLVLTFQSMPGSSGSTVSVTLPATRSYLDMHMIGGVLNFCPGIAPDSNTSDPAIIGGSLIRSQIAIFDRNSNRVGFAPQVASGPKSCQ